MIEADWYRQERRRQNFEISLALLSIKTGLTVDSIARSHYQPPAPETASRIVELMSDVYSTCQRWELATNADEFRQVIPTIYALDDMAEKVDTELVLPPSEVWRSVFRSRSISRAPLLKWLKSLETPTQDTWQFASDNEVILLVDRSGF